MKDSYISIKELIFLAYRCISLKIYIKLIISKCIGNSFETLFTASSIYNSTMDEGSVFNLKEINSAKVLISSLLLLFIVDFCMSFKK